MVFEVVYPLSSALRGPGEEALEAEATGPADEVRLWDPPPKCALHTGSAKAAVVRGERVNSGVARTEMDG